MDATYVDVVLAAMRDRNVEIEPGLSPQEFARIETKYKLRFPPDLRVLLETGLPASEYFPNWRADSEEELRWLLSGPAGGIAFDVRVNGFWMDDWGTRPQEPDDAVTVALEQVASAPPLVPVFGHRYLPSEPWLEGNPVFSVVQTDIVYYGNDLAGYFALEFGVARPAWARSAPRKIDFWSWFAESEG